MPKKGHKVIQKDILGRLGRLFSTYAGREKDLYDNKRVKKNIYKDSKNAVPSVPKTPDVSIPVNRPYWQRSDASCLACNGTDSWKSIYGVTICSRCHPPANEGLVARLHGTA